jgi:hypothetical protein
MFRTVHTYKGWMTFTLARLIPNALTGFHGSTAKLAYKFNFGSKRLHTLHEVQPFLMGCHFKHC